MASEEDISLSQDKNISTKEKGVKKRGPTTAKYIKEDDDGPYPLEWDSQGCATGKFKDRYMTYMGSLTRSKVKICINDWNEVEEDIKEMLWIAVKKLFMCDDDKRSSVLTDCQKNWKNFKSRLTREYLTKKVKNEVDNPPWVVYKGIDEDDWRLFKEHREKSEFKLLSERNRKNQANNEHPHRLGRGGYRQREEKHLKDVLKKSAISGASSSVLESETAMVVARPRYERWIDGRKDKKGDIPNENTKKMVENIYELKEKQASGEFIPVGSHDILTEALGNAEHGGHAREYGGKATISSVFKRKKRSHQAGTMTIEEVQEFAHLLTEKVKEQTKAEWKVQTLELLKSCGIRVPHDVEVNMNVDTLPNTTIEDSSCHSINPGLFANGSQDPIPCELIILGEDIGFRVVAKGELCKTEDGDLVHGVPLRKDYVKVKILHVLDGEDNTPLPVPFFGHDVLGDEVEGSWVQWPRRQVKLMQELTQPKEKEIKKIENKKEKKRKIEDKKEKTLKHSEAENEKEIFKVEGKKESKKLLDVGSGVGCHYNENEDDSTIPPFLLSKITFLSLPQSCKDLYNLYRGRDIDFNIDVVFPADIFHYPEGITFTTYVAGDELKQFFVMDRVSGSCVQIFIRYLQKQILTHKCQEVVGFLCPKDLDM